MSTPPQTEHVVALMQVDHAATAGLYLVAMIQERLDGQSAHADDLRLLTAIDGLLHRIEDLCGQALR